MSRIGKGFEFDNHYPFRFGTGTARGQHHGIGLRTVDLMATGRLGTAPRALHLALNWAHGSQEKDAGVQQDEGREVRCAPGGRYTSADARDSRREVARATPRHQAQAHHRRSSFGRVTEPAVTSGRIASIPSPRACDDAHLPEQRWRRRVPGSHGRWPAGTRFDSARKQA